MSQEIAAIRQSIRTPRAAAIAGILFAVLLITSQTLIWLSIPSDPSAPAIDIVGHSKTIMLALNLLPFAGIAFLWFIAVVRDRLGELEDRFFATVFLGSGLLYVAMIFTAAALAATLIAVLAAGPNGTYDLRGLSPRSRSGLQIHERLRNQDVRSIHDFGLYDLCPHPNSPPLGRVGRLCGCCNPVAQRWQR